MTNTSKFITFVLGAGASFEVGMPTGYELKAKIESSLSFRLEDFRRLGGGDDQLRDALLQLSQRRGAEITPSDHLSAAKLIKTGMPQAPSIDNFIDSHRSNAKVAEVGKLAIASEILKAERASKLHVNPDRIHNRLNAGVVADTWFNAFFQLLTLNAQEKDLPERLKHVQVITFNYDRTLEHYLFHSIQNYYGCSPARAADILTNLTVFHPYGKVGSLPWQNSGMAVPFGGDMHSSALIQVSTLLRTFTEGTSESESQINTIRSAVFEAEILTFLGFAYHELNLELLFGAARDSPIRHSKQVYGTAMGISESNKKAIASELANLGRYDTSQIFLRRELSAAQLLPEYSRTLRIPSAA
ncbi:hypothetical protein ACPOLB_23465 [Rubrivivax sp. RP6-9]|uniref:hypothetical protein n=1 Tax=Rubrivivax sp. RP6-9 TaxID=3415750 RepID=UPI003CC52397